MEITEQDIYNLLTSKVSRFQRRKLCIVCDHFSTQKHAGVTCANCGYDKFYSTDEFTVFRLFQIVKKHLSNETNWLPLYAALYLEQKYPDQGFMARYSFMGQRETREKLETFYKSVKAQLEA